MIFVNFPSVDGIEPVREFVSRSLPHAAHSVSTPMGYHTHTHKTMIFVNFPNADGMLPVREF